MNFRSARIPGSTLIPLGELPKRLDELDPNDEIVMHCKMGGRSAKACDLLKQNGFKKVRNMKGGIRAGAIRSTLRCRSIKAPR